MELVDNEFFNRDALQVAPELLGKIIHYNDCSGMIVECEAYKKDEASHAKKKTPRSKLMWETYAHWYIYLIYGVHWNLNITTNGEGEPGGLLIRAVKPLEGIEEMKKRRGTDDIYNLCSGPGKLCEAFSIDEKLNGSELNDKIKLEDNQLSEKQIEKTKRIGISKAEHLHWRFILTSEDKFLSR